MKKRAALRLPVFELLFPCGAPCRSPRRSGAAV